jgi:hypothetical protein
MGSSRLYQRRSDRSLIILRSISLLESIEDCQLATGIENLTNLRHPSIARPIGFEGSFARRELKTARSCARGGSLAEVFSNPPAWRTPTVKAKAVAGMTLALPLGLGFGLLHGALKAHNVLSMPITEFESPISVQSGYNRRSRTVWR